MRSVGLFSGIGGMELGLQEAGHEPVLLCELMPAARAVLKERFPDVELVDDIRNLKSLPRCDVVTAGFPCTDLSSVGRTAGIHGKDSRLVREVFRLVRQARFKPRWLVFENVPFMLTLKKGAAMKLIVSQLESMGYSWAYRVVDARAFGVPQRRRRVLIVASRIRDPRPVLLGIDAGEPQRSLRSGTGRGFYWTEGNTGLGWAPGAIPTLKGGSGFGIASPPAIWFPARQSIEMPSIRDAERLQGFSVDWTSCLGEEHRQSIRWKMVGNAVCVPMMEWLARRLEIEDRYDASEDAEFGSKDRWPTAAWGEVGRRFASSVSEWPVVEECPTINAFLRHRTTPLSHRATTGFLKRARASSLRLDSLFLADLAKHARAMKAHEA